MCTSDGRVECLIGGEVGEEEETTVEILKIGDKLI